MEITGTLSAECLVHFRAKYPVHFQAERLVHFLRNIQSSQTEQQSVPVMKVRLRQESSQRKVF